LDAGQRSCGSLPRVLGDFSMGRSDGIYGWYGWFPRLLGMFPKGLKDIFYTP